MCVSICVNACVLVCMCRTKTRFFNLSGIFLSEGPRSAVLFTLSEMWWGSLGSPGQSPNDYSSAFLPLSLHRGQLSEANC
jgi:hypothetical protein